MIVVKSVGNNKMHIQISFLLQCISKVNTELDFLKEILTEQALIGSFILRLWLFVDSGPGTLTTLLPKSLMRKSPELLSVHYTKENSSEREKKETTNVNSSKICHRYKERKRYKHRTKAHSRSYLSLSISVVTKKAL